MSVEKQSEDRGGFFVTAVVYQFVWVYCFSIDFQMLLGNRS